MRYIVTVAALILSYAPTVSYAQWVTLSGLGGQSCGKYLAAVHGHAPGKGNVVSHPQQGRFWDEHSRYMDWLSGFVGATNWFVLDERNQIQVDNAAIDVWIRKWCEQNPTEPLAYAASQFVWDQRKDYLEAWYARQNLKPDRMLGR
jgi:hypothetical protein